MEELPYWIFSMLNLSLTPEITLYSRFLELNPLITSEWSLYHSPPSWVPMPTKFFVVFTSLCALHKRNHYSTTDYLITFNIKPDHSKVFQNVGFSSWVPMINLNTIFSLSIHMSMDICFILFLSLDCCK